MGIIVTIWCRSALGTWCGVSVEAGIGRGETNRRVEGELYGDAEAWSLSALGLFSVVSAWLEPDPEIDWDRERIDTLRKRLEAGGNLFEVEKG